MSSNQDAFLKDLQGQCLSDSKEHLDGMIEALSHLQQDVLESLKLVAKNVHSLKGNVQATGFADLGRFLHNFESIIAKIEKSLMSGHEIAEEERSVFEFLLSDVHHYISDYINALSADFTDSVEKFEARVQCLKSLDYWWQTYATANSIPIIEEISNPIKVDEVSNQKFEIVGNSNDWVHAPAEQIIIQQHAYLLCRVGTRHYGIDVDHITEVINDIPIIQLPLVREDIRGLINLRGETVSILSLNRILGDVKEGHFLVVCSHEGRSFGFQVDEAEQIVTLKDDALQELSIGGTSNNQKEAISSVAHLPGDREILILNLNRVIAA